MWARLDRAAATARAGRGIMPLRRSLPEVPPCSGALSGFGCVVPECHMLCDPGPSPGVENKRGSPRERDIGQDRDVLARAEAGGRRHGASVVNAMAFELANVGVYRLPMAARLAEVPVSKARSWVKGYPRRSSPISSKASAPLPPKSSPPSKLPARLPPRLEQTGPEAVVSFVDLIEMRFVRHFREAGVKWSAISRSLEELHAIFRESPTREITFESDGVRVFANQLAKTGDRHGRDLTSGNFVMADVLRGTFRDELRLGPLSIVEAWQPRAAFPLVILDPRRQFGQPIVEPGIPTSVIADEFLIRKGDAEKVARRYGVEVEAVKDAVRFEQSLKGSV